MSAAINNGGPAVPVPLGQEKAREGHGPCCDGMTLRDYFAAAALKGLIGRSWDDRKTAEELFRIWAASAYALADAMLDAREQKGGAA